MQITDVEILSYRAGEDLTQYSGQLVRLCKGRVRRLLKNRVGYYKTRQNILGILINTPRKGEIAKISTNGTTFVKIDFESFKERFPGYIKD